MLKLTAALRYTAFALATLAADHLQDTLTLSTFTDQHAVEEPSAVAYLSPLDL